MHHVFEYVMHELFDLGRLDSLASVDLVRKLGLHLQRQVIRQTSTLAQSLDLPFANEAQQPQDAEEVRETIASGVSRLEEGLCDQSRWRGVSQLVEHVPQRRLADRSPTLFLYSGEDGLRRCGLVFTQKPYVFEEFLLVDRIAFVDVHFAPILPSPLVRKRVPEPGQCSMKLKFTQRPHAARLVHVKYLDEFLYFGAREAFSLPKVVHHMQNILEDEILYITPVSSNPLKRLIDHIGKCGIVQAMYQRHNLAPVDCARLVLVEFREKRPQARNFLFETDPHHRKELLSPEDPIAIDVERFDDPRSLIDGGRRAEVSKQTRQFVG
mmetsp:Transcript_19889/g.54966  ORF Transcript_19889/g.54966 Transcript_19889/m.54966 type:complete len:324 (+) Transcript_19889:487-1458(+)